MPEPEGIGKPVIYSCEMSKFEEAATHFAPALAVSNAAAARAIEIPAYKRFVSAGRAIVRASHQVCDGRHVPLSAAGCPNAALVEPLCDSDHADRPR